MDLLASLRGPAVATVALLLAGCGTAPDDPTGPPTPDRVALLTVHGRLHRPPGSGRYTEGAMAEVRLRDATGTRVGVRRSAPGGTVVFEDLAPGDYVLEPALRPCDASCGMLDARTDSWSAALHLTGDRTVRVRYEERATCTVRPGRAMR